MTEKEELVGLAAVRAGPGHDIHEAGFEPAELATLARRCLHAAGYYPVEVENPILGDRKSGKAPMGKCWQIGDEEPECIHWDRADPRGLNTGVLCATLRALDIDISDERMADEAHELAEHHLGVSPSVRTRAGTGRRAALYRAAEGQPGKRALCAPEPSDDKIELLGRGQQLVVYGTHWSGDPLLWHGPPGILVPRDALPAVTEEQVAAYLDACAERFGWPVAPTPRAVVDDGWRPAADLRGDMPIADVVACFNAIPNWGGNIEYYTWLRLGMSAHAATGGSSAGLDAWIEWSGMRDANVCRQKWRGFGGGRIGPGTLVHEARLHQPDLKLSPRPGAAPSDERLSAALLAMRRKWR